MKEHLSLPVKPVRPDEFFVLPSRANPDDAGLDLYACHDIEIKPGDGFMIKTNISIQLPRHHVGLICDRSSMGRDGLKVHGGVVDAGYTGEIMVVLWNHSKNTFKKERGAKIAQLLIMPILTPAVVVTDTLSQSDRGDKGFGSSGA